VARGVITSVLQEKVRIPEELHLALHRNREMEYVCPFPATFIESSCRTAAQKMWEQLQSQLQDKTQEPLKLKFTICENTESPEPVKSSRKNSKYEK
jgi:DNA-binding LacI/PurR family transcriptional regulator